MSVAPERHEDLLKDCDEAIHEREEELFVDLERYDGLLNDCVAWIHERTGIPSSKLLEVATSTPEGEEWGYIYTELKKLEERRVNAVLWTALLSRDQDALMSVGLLPPSESSPPATETERQGSKADHESGLTTMLSVGLLPSSESSPAVPEAERQGSKADNESGPTTMPNAETLALRNEVESGPDAVDVQNSMRRLTNVPAVEPGTSQPAAALVVHTFAEWQTLLSWAPTTWARRRKEFPDCFNDVPGENSCSIREPERSQWLASAVNKKRSPFEKT